MRVQVRVALVAMAGALLLGVSECEHVDARRSDPVPLVLAAREMASPVEVRRSFGSDPLR